MRRLEENTGLLASEGLFQEPAPLASLDREKASEEKFGGGQAAADQCRDRSRRAGDDFVGDAGPADFMEQALARVADQRHACIGDDGHTAPFPQLRQQLLRTTRLVVLMQTEQWLAHAMVL